MYVGSFMLQQQKISYKRSKHQDEYSTLYIVQYIALLCFLRHS